MMTSLSLICLFFASLQVWATQPTTFVSVPGDPFDNGYPEERYHQILDRLQTVYDPIIAAEGGTFVIERDWSDGAVNMWAERWGQEYRLEVPGGMARYYLINEDAFLLSLCHELGHLLGGAPQKGLISFEGQADYYATLSCLKTVLPEIEAWPQDSNPDSEVTEACLDVGEINQSSCQRSLSGAKRLTSLYAELEQASFPQIKTPSSVVIGETLISHPPAQCRLDTFVAGYLIQPRPRCWYRPVGSEPLAGQIQKTQHIE